MINIDAFQFLRKCDFDFEYGDGSVAAWAYDRCHDFVTRPLSACVIQKFHNFVVAYNDYTDWLINNGKGTNKNG